MNNPEKKPELIDNGIKIKKLCCSLCSQISWFYIEKERMITCYDCWSTKHFPKYQPK